MRRSPGILVIAAGLLIVATHTCWLAEIPAGLYVDESSIGYNAALLAETGADEHGERYPIYFEAFGEYKNPVYVYAAALVFELFGVSQLHLRLTSFAFFAAALLLTVVLVFRMFEGDRALTVYALITLGFLPVYFTLSRIAFEVISQLTWIAAAHLGVWLTFHDRARQAAAPAKALACGLVLGTSIYTYSTARLLSPLMLAALWVSQLRRRSLRRLTLLTLGFLLSLVPYLVFAIHHPDAATGRFKQISYLDDPISLTVKIALFLRNLAAYWSPGFLILDGDPNLRHSTGHGGIVFVTTLILFAVGLAGCVRAGRRLHPFQLFLVLELLLAPSAAALTLEGTPHALRSSLLGYFIFLISCYGARGLGAIRVPSTRRLLTAGLALLLTLEILAFQADYFLRYPAKSVEAMESFGLKSSLAAALAHEPRWIFFLNQPQSSYASLAFASYLVANPRQVPMTLSEHPRPAPGSCVLFHRWSENELDAFPHPYTEHHAVLHPNAVQRWGGAEPVEGIVQARCYALERGLGLNPFQPADVNASGHVDAGTGGLPVSSQPRDRHGTASHTRRAAPGPSGQFRSWSDLPKMIN